MQARTRCWSTPSTELRKHQPASYLNLRHDHGLRLGPVIRLERDEGGTCWAVAVSEHDVPNDGWYFSAETDANRDGTDVVITGIGLVERTAQTCLAPVNVLPGDLDDYRRPDSRRHLGHVAGQILGHAAEHHEHHRHRDAGGLVVHDMRPPVMLTRSLGVDAFGDRIPVTPDTGGPIAHDDDGRPIGPMWIRPSHILSVGGLPVRPR